MFTNLANVVVLLDSCHQRLVFKGKVDVDYLPNMPAGI